MTNLPDRPAPWCWMCGQNHWCETTCDPERLAWVQRRRKEAYLNEHRTLAEQPSTARKEG